MDDDYDPSAASAAASSSQHATTNVTRSSGSGSGAVSADEPPSSSVHHHPDAAVLRRLRSVTAYHASSLASICTVAAASSSSSSPSLHGRGDHLGSGGGAADDDRSGKNLLASLSHRRSLCPQPPLDSARNCDGSRLPRDGTVIDLDLNPPERVPPHRIVPGLGFGGFGGGGEGSIYDGGAGTATAAAAAVGIIQEADDGATGDGHRGASFAARKAIAALAALCDEARELELMADRRLLPALALFGTDLKRGAGLGTTINATMSDGRDGMTIPTAVSKEGGGGVVSFDDMDEVATAKRDAELLRRVGKFVPALQETFNFTLRCRRLVRNMVCQIGGCASPMAAAAAGDVAVAGEMNGGGICENGTRSVASAAAASAVFGPEVRLLPIAEAIARLLRVLIAIDTVVARNGPLGEGWDLYKAVMHDRAVKLQTEGRRDETLESFERLLVQLDFTLLSSRSFVTAIEQNFDPGSHYRVDAGETTAAPSAAAAAEAFTLYGEVKALLTVLYGRCCERIGTDVESDDRDVAVGVYGMYCLYRRLLPSHVIPDARLHRSLWTDLPTKCPVLAGLFCDAPFRPREFLLRYAPYEGLRGCTPAADPAELRADATERVRRGGAALPGEVVTLKSDAVRWLAAADSDLAPPPPPGAGRATCPEEDPSVTVERTVTQILRGVALARRSAALLRNHLVACSALDLPIEAGLVPSLMSLCEIVKSVEKTLRVRRRAAVVSVQRAALKMVSASIYRRFEPLRLVTDQYQASVDHSDITGSTSRIARISACLSSLEGLLKGSSTFSPARRFAVEIAVRACTVDGDDFTFELPAGTEGLLEQLCLLSDLDDNLRRACDCSFLYFHRDDLFALVAREIYGKSTEMERFQLICSAFSDAGDEFLHLAPPEMNDGVLCANAYREHLCGAVQEEVISPLCQTIETELRLAVYTKSLEQMKQSNPKQDSSQKVRHFLELPTLCICGKEIDIRRAVQEYLDNVFYLMSSVSLNDARTYAEMRVVARIYGLELLDNCLPFGSFGQGVDLLHIMRNMDDVVSRYNYDMNQQILIERRPYRDAKYVRTIGAQNISASLCQHGLGVVGTAVDSACTVISEKLNSFSQSLRNDYLSSLLSKEVRWFCEHKGEYGGAYPFSRAVEFSQEIRKLGSDDDGTSLMDQLRILISEVGNALGFVRMVWSAEMQICSEKLEPASACSNAQCLGETDALPPSLREAVSNMDAAISKPTCCFEQRPHIRRILGTFKNTTLDEDHSHLKSIYALIPALCLGWMDASLRGKEMMHKNNITRDVYYTDDGFAMGIAFLLAIYQQDEPFDAMNWFASVRQRIAFDGDVLAEEMAAHDARKGAAQANQKGSIFSFSRTATVGEGSDPNEDDEVMTNLTLTGKKLEARKRETKMLFCSFHCARILLKEK